MGSERWSRLLALTFAVSTLSACVHGQCVASASGTHGSNTSCCSNSLRYSWTGTRCEADPFCECDAQTSSPTWSTLTQCEDVHHRCGSFDKD